MLHILLPHPRTALRGYVANQGRGQRFPRFVPASLLPDGGFGDPDLKRPLWRIPKGTKADRVALAQAQHRLACAVRVELDRRGMSEAELETQLGYRRHLLSRKLNGGEAMSTTDIVRIANGFGPSVVAALAE